INSGGGAGPADAFIAKIARANRAAISIAGVLPKLGGNAGNVTARVVGSGFQANATMKLVCTGQADIIATNTTVTSDGRTITGTFALAGSATETCDVIVTNPDGGSASDPQAFTVEPGGAPNMWVDIVGLRNARGGATQSYYVVYGNRGNVDAAGILVSAEVPTNLTWTLSNGEVPLYQDGQIKGAMLRGFSVPVVATQSSSAIVLTVTTPTLGVDVFLPFRLSATISLPNQN
ncbi:MAG: hypothetical protein WA672_21255, partial [Candidatus Angelobacter sp.]